MSRITGVWGVTVTAAALAFTGCTSEEQLPTLQEIANAPSSEASVPHNAGGFLVDIKASASAGNSDYNKPHVFLAVIYYPENAAMPVVFKQDIPYRDRPGSPGDTSLSDENGSAWHAEKMAKSICEGIAWQRANKNLSRPDNGGVKDPFGMTAQPEPEPLDKDFQKKLQDTLKSLLHGKKQFLDRELPAQPESENEAPASPQQPQKKAASGKSFTL